jgi:hypothetical protein
MSCNFVDSKCILPGNSFACKKCTSCGKTISLPAKLAATNWPTLIATTKNQCGQNAAQPKPIATPQAPAAPVTQPTAAVMQPTAPQPTPTEPPAAVGPDPFAPPKLPFDGAGTYLKKYLGRIGITATPTCSCNAKAQHMDIMGVKWCEENVDLIVSWLKEQATNRNLPFVELPARLLVKHAISSAKKAEKAYLKTLNLEENLPR